MIPAVRNVSRRSPAVSPGVPARRPTPFDYAFRYELSGQPGNVLNQVITISVEGTFTAASNGYVLFDEGSGREFQSEPIMTTAGLGSANGERPFRYFARPIIFKPRSTIRMEVTEVSDFSGELHVSLHGYKVLGDPDSPTGTAQRRATRGSRR